MTGAVEYGDDGRGLGWYVVMSEGWPGNDAGRAGPYKSRSDAEAMLEGMLA